MSKKSKQRLTPAFYAIAVFILGCVGSGSIAWNTHHNNLIEAEARVAKEASQLIYEITERMQRYEYGLRGMRGHILSLGENGVTREMFRNYSKTRDIQAEFPGARGMGFIRRVPLKQEDNFVAKARADAKPDFNIKQLTTHDRERYIIQYLEPEESNASAIGLDIGSEEYRRFAAEEAIKTAKVRLTGPITLVQEKGKELQSFLILLPIYRGWVTPASQKERELNAFGWAYAPLQMEEVLGDLILDPLLYTLELRDLDTKDKTLFFSNQSKKSKTIKLHTQILTKDIHGRLWQLELSVSPHYIKQLNQNNSWFIFAVGIVISLLLAILAAIYGVHRLAKLKIYREQARLAAVLESALDGIIGINLDGKIISWNTGAERLFGYSAGEATGLLLQQLIKPVYLADDVTPLEILIAQGKSIEQLSTVGHHRDGHLIDMSINAAPIRNSKGQLLASSLTIRDVTEQKAAEAKIRELNMNLEVQVQQRTAELNVARRSLQTVLDGVPAVIGYWDKDQINTVANEAYEDRFGIPIEKIKGMHLRELVGDSVYEVIHPHVETVLRGVARSFEFSATSLDDEATRHYLAQYLPDVTVDGIHGFYVIEQDITEIVEGRLQLTAALKENEGLLDTINKQMLYSVTDAKGLILDVNENFCTTSGYSRAELIGNNHRLLRSSIHERDFWHDMWSTITSGTVWRGEICNSSKQGEMRWFDTVIAPFTNAVGEIERYVALRTDITARKTAETRLEELNQLLTNVLSATTEVSIIATDASGMITLFNVGAERMLGYRAEELVNKSSPAILHRADEITARGKELTQEYGIPIEGFRVFVHKPDLFDAETRNWTYVHKDGHSITVALSATAMRDEKNQVIGYLGVAIDVTQQIQAQKELAALRDQLTIAADVARLGIWTWMLADNRLLWNERMFSIYDQPLELLHTGVDYNHWRERVHPEDLPQTEALLMAAVESGSDYHPIFRVVNRAGAIRHILAGARVERDSSGRAISVTGINLDITEQYLLENELRNAKQQADLASTTKSNFLANMSHEIRTPMNAVLGMLQLVQHTDLNTRQLDYISKAETAAKSLLGLLNDILDFSKMEAGKLELDPHPFEIEGLMRDLAVVLSGNHGDKDVEVMFDITPRLPRLLIGDRLRLQQILINLASNALKFTPSGHVLVGASKVRQTQTDITLNFSVADTGIGISAEQQTRIFEGFVQAEASTTRRFGGTGLGLVISKRLTNMMGGELLLESEIGKGSRFSFDITFPIADSASADGIPHIAGSSLSDIKLLVVDDNPLVLEVLVHTLAALGFKVHQADGGFAAVELVRKAEQRGLAYDVVLMDWRMPDMDGLSAAQLIRTASKNNNPPVVIMVTAHEREVLVRQDDSSVPYAELLTKPVTPQQLANSIWQSFKKLKPSPDSRKIIEHKLPLKGINLLVVEDNELNRQVAQELLTNAGAYVELAHGGIEGVEKVTKGSHPYDLVLMDIQMPDIDGYEATHRIRAEQRFEYLPILAMTANASVSDKDACMAAGMNGHVGKPFDMELLVTNILRLLGRESLASPPSAEDTSDEDVIIDQHQVILKRFGGNQHLFTRMLTSFRPEIMRLMVALELSCKHQNESGIKAALHSMRGVAATMGARALAKTAGELEQSCNGKSIHEIELLVDDLVRNKLMQLFELSDKLLAKLISETPQPEEERELKSLSSAEWQLRLSEIMQLLETDNLAAIDQVEALLLTVKNHEKLNQLLAEVNSLNYEKAIETLNVIIEESPL